MTFEDIINEYKNARSRHLTEDELDAYYYNKLNMAIRARADAHLKDCLRCNKQLADLREESAVLINRERTAEDHALIDRAMQQVESQRDTAGSKTTRPVMSPALLGRLVEYLEQVVRDWKAYFGQLEATRGSVDVWEWQSEDGALKARAVQEEDNSLTIHFASNEMDLEGVRLKVRLGPIEHETTLERLSESEVSAQIRVSRYELPKKPSDISIEIG
ncbi:MAG TPA: hypothetical protein VLR90_19955 [Blastocatellia bacterium]|nr:hypothetical protein [Blastocatellia bacterium]